jgi:putative transposase
MGSSRLHRTNYNLSGQAHELTFSCFRGYPFLRADRCCEWLREAIDQARADLDFDLWAYVFMPEHVHLIVRPRQVKYQIAAIRHSIKQPVARRAMAFLRKNAPEWLPRLTRPRGSRGERLFWQSGGGYDRNIDNGETLLRMLNYIHLNPVRRKLASIAGDWYWSSAAWYDRGRNDPITIDQIPQEWLVDCERT